jgi:hypothetical protein
MRATRFWLLAVVAACLPLPDASARLPEILRIDQLAERYTTPKAVATFLRKEFTFKRDTDLFGQIDWWQEPEEFLLRRAGDCEDYALLARELLARNWIKAHVFSLFGYDGYAHTVCIFVDEQGRYNVINQDKLRYYRAPSLEALAAQIYPGWTFGGIAERDGGRGRFVSQITNEHPIAPVAPASHDAFGF